MRTESRRTRGICLLLVMMLLAGALSVMGGASKASAAEKKLMDKLKINWDLKEGKTYTAVCNDKLTSVDGNKLGFTLTNLKKEDLKNGRKKVSFSINFSQPNYKFSNQKIHNMANYGDDIKVFGDNYFTVIDKATGLSLEGDNDLGVKVANSGWKNYGQYEKQYDNDGCSSLCWKNTAVKVVITYPADYKDLCVGVGNTISTPKWKDKNAAFWDGKKSFDKTTMYKLFNDDAHFINFK